MASHLAKPKLKAPISTQTDPIAYNTLTSDFRSPQNHKKGSIPKIKLPPSHVTFTDFREIVPSYGITTNESITNTDRASPPLMLPFSVSSSAKLPASSPKSFNHVKSNSVQFSKTAYLASKTDSTENRNRLSIRLPEEQKPLKPNTFRGLENPGLITERSENSTEGFDSFPVAKYAQTVRHSPAKSRGHAHSQSIGFKSYTARFTSEDLEGIEESVYEKNPEITEKGSKVYKDKVSALNYADARKSQAGTQSLRREFLQNESTFLTRVPLLKSRQHSQMVSLRVDDEGFFKKAAEIFNEGVKELDYENITYDEEKELHEEKLTTIQLDKLRFSYCYINVKGKGCPLTITLLCPRDMKELKICVSMVQKKPTKLNCDTEFKTRLFKLYDKNKMATRFSNSYFYFALFADTAGVVSIKAEFNQDGNSNRKKLNPIPQTLKKKAMQTDLISSLSNYELEYEISNIKKERKEKMLQLSAGVNKIQLNKNIEQYTPYKAYEKRQALRQKSEEMLLTARSKKEYLDQQKFDSKVASMMKHDIQKKIREMTEEENRKLMMTKFCIKQWFMSIFITNLGDSVKQFLKKQKQIIAQQIRMKQVLCSFSRKAKKILQKRAPLLETRFSIDIRLALQLKAHIFRRHNITSVEKVMVSFLQSSMNARFIHSKLLNTVHAIRKAQGTWRGYTQRKEAFKTLLLHLWERNYTKMFDEVMQAGQTGQSPGANLNHKQYMKKFNCIEMRTDELAKKRFIKMWFKECVALYRKNYDVHSSEVFKLSPEAKKQLMIQNLSRETKEREEEAPRHKNKKVSSQILMQELQKYRTMKIDYSGKDVTLEEKLITPKLFILPDEDQLNNLLKEIVLFQKASKIGLG